MKAPNHTLEQRLLALQAGDHLCGLYQSAAEHRLLLAPFIRHGLERQEKVCYFSDGRSAAKVLGYLRADGVEVGHYTRRGQLAMLSRSETCLQGGVFEPEKMMTLLREQAELAGREGFQALRLALEMSWVLGGCSGHDHLAAYESGLNRLLAGIPSPALCMYNRRLFVPELLLEVLAAHPLVAAKGDIYENFYYMPPEDLFGADAAAVKLKNWLNNLAERKRSESQIRMLTQKLMQSQEDERGMISRELHDRVGQDLSGIKVALETLFDPHPSAAAEIRDRVSLLARVLDRTIYTVRDLAYDLRPPGLDDMGIMGALDAVCRDFSEKSRIRVAFYGVGVEKAKLDFSTKTSLYRMVQEGLSNVQRHAHATCAVVKLTAAYPHVILRIEDNGCGFDVAKRTREVDSEKRMGLRSLQERALLLGGTMIVRSKPGQGTKILIKLPQPGGRHGSQKNRSARG